MPFQLGVEVLERAGRTVAEQRAERTAQVLVDLTLLGEAAVFSLAVVPGELPQPDLLAGRGLIGQRWCGRYDEHARSGTGGDRRDSGLQVAGRRDRDCGGRAQGRGR